MPDDSFRTALATRLGEAADGISRWIEYCNRTTARSEARAAAIRALKARLESGEFVDAQGAVNVLKLDTAAIDALASGASWVGELPFKLSSAFPDDEETYRDNEAAPALGVRELRMRLIAVCGISCDGMTQAVWLEAYCRAAPSTRSLRQRLEIVELTAKCWSSLDDDLPDFFESVLAVLRFVENGFVDESGEEPS